VNSFGGEALASVLSTVADMMNDLRSELTGTEQKKQKGLGEAAAAEVNNRISEPYILPDRTSAAHSPWRFLNLHGDSEEPRGTPGSHGD
jgi:hypothetical protein